MSATRFLFWKQSGFFLCWMRNRLDLLLDSTSISLIIINITCYHLIKLNNT